MCWFAVVGVPVRSEALLDEAFPPPNGRQGTYTEWLSIRAPGLAARTVTNGHCSCDLVGGTRAAERARQIERERRKYEKRGWSASKSERAIAQMAESGHEPSRAWADFLDAVATLATKAGEAWLLVHTDPEPMPDPLSSLLVTPDALRQLDATPTDVLVHVR